MLLVIEIPTDKGASAFSPAVAMILVAEADAAVNVDAGVDSRVVVSAYDNYRLQHRQVFEEIKMEPWQPWSGASIPRCVPYFLPGAAVSAMKLSKLMKPSGNPGGALALRIHSQPLGSLQEKPFAYPDDDRTFHPIILSSLLPARLFDRSVSATKKHVAGIRHICLRSQHRRFLTKKST